MNDFAAVETAETYDDALKAFLEAPESHEGSPEPILATPAVAPPSDTTPAAPPTMQPAQTPAQPSAEEVQATADREALLNRPVPATAEFPKMFHNRPMRDLIASFSEKDRYITETRTQLQTKNDELIAAQATARVLAGQLQQRNQPPATAPSPAAPGVDEFYQRHGMADPFKAFTETPEAFFAKVARGAAADAVTQVREEMGGRFAPLEKVVGDAQANQQVGVARNAVDRAFDQIVEQDKVTDPQIRAAMRTRFDRLFAYNNAALATSVCSVPGAAANPESWVKAYRGQEEAIGGFGPLLSISAATLPTGTKPNPPSSARVGASVAGAGQRTVAGRRSEVAFGLLGGFSEADRAKYGDLISQEIEQGLVSGQIAK